ncbi:MAG: hypothetical protein JJU45_04820 [Acidimicrobiia bacterium]|nr:hypothetical protein [Acidimicrobiia bacterium]
MGGNDEGWGGLDEATTQDVAAMLWQRELDPDTIPDDLAATLASPRNSAAAHGERMRRFLEHLLESRPSHTVDRSDLYRALLDEVDELNPLQLYVLRNLLDRNANEGYEPVPNPVVLEFPRDHALKVDSQVGWHFFVGSCWDTDGEEYGVEIMFFGDAVFPPAIAAELGLTPIENQAIEMQFAVSRRGGDHLQAAPVVVAGTSGLISATDDPFSLRLGRNSMVSSRAGELFPLRLQMWGLDRSAEEPTELAIDVTFTSGKEYLAQGDHGAMPSVDGMGTLYYSIPNMQIDPATSWLRIGDNKVDLARGAFWFDHQWGYLNGNCHSTVMRAASGTSDPVPVGWDWFMCHFVGDRQITCFSPHTNEMSAFYDQSGDEPPGTMAVRVAGTYMDTDRSTRMAWGLLEVDRWVKVERSPDPERYPATGVWHPDHFHFTFDDLPEDIREFTMTPIVDGGQSAFFANGAQICEGAVVLADPDGTDVGRGFAESVHYAETIDNMVRLAGLPTTDEWIERVGTKPPSLAAKTWNALYVVAHRHQLGEVMGEAKGLEFFHDPKAS